MASVRGVLHRGAKSSPLLPGLDLGLAWACVRRRECFSSLFPEAAPSLQFALGGEVSFYN